MAMRVANGVMVLVFLLAVAVQYNDPDPALWMAAYAVAAAFALAGAFGRHYGIVWIAALAFIVGTVYWLPGVDLSDPASLVTDVQMNSLGVEETREALGLFICAIWMTVLGVVWMTRRNPRPVNAPAAPTEDTP